jgi:hypothetical protein
MTVQPPVLATVLMVGLFLLALLGLLAFKGRLRLLLWMLPALLVGVALVVVLLYGR